LNAFQTPNKAADWLRERVSGDLTCDSRQVTPGDAFVAWPGAATDGRRYVGVALQAGAAAALVESEGAAGFDLDDARVAAVSGLKRLAGPIASAFHRDPSAALDVVAFTGTNGKTSSAWWMAQLLSEVGRRCALVGTLGIGQPDSGNAPPLMPLVSTGLTTPDPVLLQSRLRVMVDAGFQACAIEASSIGLEEGRLNATRIRVGVFTNFTQDHLDYHGSMERYWAAKLALFDAEGLAHAVLNLDDPRGPGLAAHLSARGLDVWTVGIEDEVSKGARLFARDLGVTRQGMRCVLGERDGSGRMLDAREVSLPLVGRYNVSNLLGVIAAARALGVALADAVAACTSLTAVPGRMEWVTVPGECPLVLVDYAHTPDALEKALQALQPLARQRKGSLWVVAGCGGDRDAGKRPLMGAVAEREADRVVLTSDNPRSEDPQAILAHMLVGLAHPERARVEADRATAIRAVVGEADAHDVVLIAGKGHEEYQDMQGVKRPFSDRQHAREALLDRTRHMGAVA
jgi:UDP-N-acetylmuramyl-tripeptide synthetase